MNKQIGGEQDTSAGTQRGGVGRAEGGMGAQALGGRAGAIDADGQSNTARGDGRPLEQGVNTSSTLDTDLGVATGTGRGDAPVVEAGQQSGGSMSGPIRTRSGATLGGNEGGSK